MKFILVAFFCLFIAGCYTKEYMVERSSKRLTELLNSADKQRIEKVIIVPDAQFTLLYIKQQHYSDIYTAKILEQLKAERSKEKRESIKKRYFEVLDDINAVQKEVSDFLEQVTDSYDIIYSEGLPFKDTYSKTFLERYVEETLDAVDQIQNYKEHFDYKIPEPNYFIGSTFYLKKERAKKVFGAENFGLLDLTISTYSNDELSDAAKQQLLKVCHKEREWQMVINMSKELDVPYLEPPVKFLVCGSRHEFKDDVQRWNKENPEKKYNLLVYTPLSLKQK